MTRCRGLSPPKHPISISTAPSASAEVYLRVVSGGTSYFRSRLAFHPYTQVIGKICTSLPVRASTLLSKGFTLPTHRSTGFGYPTNDLSRAHDAPRLTRRLRAFGFPTDARFYRLTSPLVRTPWPVFRNGRYDTAPRLTTLLRFHAVSVYSCLVSGSFHPP